MDDIQVDSRTGDVKQGAFGPTLANLDPKDQKTLKDRAYGREIAYLEDDGTIRTNRYGATIGFAGSDGTVRKDGPFGAVVGRVQPPHVHIKAALLLIR